MKEKSTAGVGRDARERAREHVNVCVRACETKWTFDAGVSEKAEIASWPACRDCRVMDLLRSLYMARSVGAVWLELELFASGAAFVRLLCGLMLSCRCPRSPGRLCGLRGILRRKFVRQTFGRGVDVELSQPTCDATRPAAAGIHIDPCYALHTLGLTGGRTQSF